MNEIEQVKLACESGDFQKLQHILTNSDDQNLINAIYERDDDLPQSDSLLHIAVRNNNLECAKVVLYWPSFEHCSILNSTENSPLYLALENNYMDIADLILRQNIVPQTKLYFFIIQLPVSKLKLILENQNIDLFGFPLRGSFPEDTLLILTMFSRAYDFDDPIECDCFKLLCDRYLKIIPDNDFEIIFKILVTLTPVSLRKNCNYIFDTFYKINNSKYSILQKGLALAAQSENLNDITYKSFLVLHDSFNAKATYTTLDELFESLDSTVYDLVGDLLEEKNEDLLNFFCVLLKGLNLEYVGYHSSDDFSFRDLFLIRFDRDMIAMVKILFNCLIELNFSFNKSIFSQFGFGFLIRDVKLSIALMLPFSSCFCGNYLITPQDKLNYMLGLENIEDSEAVKVKVFPLQQLCRLKVRNQVYSTVGGNNRTFINAIMSLDLPIALKNFLRFNSVFSEFK